MPVRKRSEVKHVFVEMVVLDGTVYDSEGRKQPGEMCLVNEVDLPQLRAAGRVGSVDEWNAIEAAQLANEKVAAMKLGNGQDATKSPNYEGTVVVTPSPLDAPPPAPVETS